MRTDIEFDSGGETCAAWLYRPTSTGPYPCVVMAHGFSGVREQRLDAYAEHFVRAGMAVLLFDYRYFGASTGEPRQLVNIRHQLQDWEAAIATARALPDVDPSRIALFGSSFSGGHVQTLAVRDRGLAAVIAQVPFCDGLRTIPTLEPLHATRLTLAGLRDLATQLLGMEPYRVAAAGAPGAVAAMATPDAVPSFAGMTPAGSNWRNAVCARITLSLWAYRPGAAADKINSPILYCIAENDMLTPARFAHDAARRARRSEVKAYSCSHFDVYVSPLWEKAVDDQSDFLVRHLMPRA